MSTTNPFPAPRWDLSDLFTDLNDPRIEAALTQAKERAEQGIFWAAHQADLPYCQIERLFNLQELPSTGFTVSCFPLKVVGGSAGPCRAVAILDDAAITDAAPQGC